MAERFPPRPEDHDATSVSADAAPREMAEPERTRRGHPEGLWVLFITEMWERFSYYGMPSGCELSDRSGGRYKFRRGFRGRTFELPGSRIRCAGSVPVFPKYLSGTIDV